MFTNHIYLIYMYKLDLVLNILQCLICHKTQPNQTGIDNIHMDSLFTPSQCQLFLVVRIYFYIHKVTF